MIYNASLQKVQSAVRKVHGVLQKVQRRIEMR
jgi:hypothetical protein